MDSKVADFFKEIDALTVPEELLEDAYRNSSILPEAETIKHCGKKDIASESQCDAGNLGRKEAFCPWQEIQDDSSGYSYYWNVHTNEVTWDCPQEYALYVQSTYSGESSVDKKAKKEKKKKESPALPVGAIIPISYYGNSSSSEESSDVEKESSKSSRKEKHAKVSTVKKTKTSKKLSKNKLDEKASCDVIGPQLPPDFQFPVTIPLSPTHNDSSETVSPKVTEDARDAGLSKSSNSPEQSEQSICNKLVESSMPETKIFTLDKKSDESGKESPVSVVPKEENGLNEKVSHQTTNGVFGLRPVVDYDSFTDEEDEVEASNDSPPKDVIPDEIKPELVEIKFEKQEVVQSSCHLFPIVPEQKAETIGVKRKVEETKELPFKAESVKKLRKSEVNIDKLFAAHTTYGKHGFGFGWQNQPDTDDFGSESEPKSRTQKLQSDKAPINFVKSNDILDLNLLNDDSNLAKSSDGDEEIEEEMPVSAAEVEMEEKPVIVSTVTEESDIPIESDAVCIAKDSDSSQAVVLKGEHGDIIINKKKKENSSEEKVAQAVELASLDIEEDIEEIDRALCAALEAKKAAKSSLKASSVPISDDLKNDCDPTCVKLTVNSTESDNDVEFGNGKEWEAIYELSTDVIDKLTFLLSNQTALASHNAFLVQLQTRFVDWQAKALDTKYFTARLGEVQDYLQSYEAGIISGNWMCQWDRVNKRYFYVNKVTQAAQWIYPEDSSQSEADSPLSSPQNEFLQKASVTSTVSATSLKPSFTSISTGRFVSSPPPPPPGVDSPPPLPPHTPPPDRLPPPPPDLTTRRDPEDMDLENSSDFSSMPFISKKNVGYLDEEDDRGSFPQMPDSPNMSPNIDSSMTSTFMTGFNDLNAATKLSQSSSTDGLDVTGAQSSCAQRNGSESSVSAEASQSAEVDASSHSSSNTSQPDPSRLKTNKTVATGVKKEKKKKKLQLGIGLKKKNMPSLVEKWLKIKEEQEKEDNDSEVLKSDSAL